MKLYKILEINGDRIININLKYSEALFWINYHTKKGKKVYITNNN